MASAETNNKQEEQEVYYSVTEAVELSGLSRHKILKALHNGTVPARRVGWNWIIPRKAIPILKQMKARS